MVKSASSCHGRTDQWPDAAPEGEASTKIVEKSCCGGCRPSATARRPAIEQARGFLAGEGDGLGPIAPHLFMEAGNIDGEREGLMVHSRPELAKIGEADAEFQ
jgi:hypothetical protein